MTAPPRALRALLLTATILALGCVDTPTGPNPRASPAAPADDLLGSLDGSQVHLLRRQVPLAADETVTRTIGLLGGVIHLPQSGFVVVVPPFAVSTPTTITVVAPAGDLVGYHFFPAGLEFQVPLLATQNLLATTASFPDQVLGGNLVAAYVQGELAPTMEALEVLPLDVNGALGSFYIRHFSGYVIATD